MSTATEEDPKCMDGTTREGNSRLITRFGEEVDFFLSRLVSARVHEGAFIISGTLPSYRAKQLVTVAAQVAMSGKSSLQIMNQASVDRNMSMTIF